MGNDLERVAGGPVLTVSAGGRSVSVSPIRVRELAAFTRALEPILARLGGADAGSVNWSDLALDILAKHAERVVELVAIGARMEAAEVESLSIPELVELAGAVCAVNVDFFVQAVMPATTAALGSVTAALESGSKRSGS